MALLDEREERVHGVRMRRAQRLNVDEALEVLRQQPLHRGSPLHGAAPRVARGVVGSDALEAGAADVQAHGDGDAGAVLAAREAEGEAEAEGEGKGEGEGEGEGQGEG